ncbi:isoprenoid synthase domain-containing protein [Mycena leptocephala]|nr:isoprenoid synthase domain-containing protein [Mycena leptocephala]
MYLPDPMKTWPWTRQINPHYKEVSAQSTAWLHSLKLLGPKSQRAFDKCDTEHLRTGLDLLNLTFVADEYNELESVNGVRQMKERPAHEIRLGRATQEFWTLAVKTASPTSQKHFIESFTGYLDAIIQEADDRDADAVLTIANYLDIRARNIAAYPAFVPCELHLDLPDDIFHHPIITELRGIVAQLLVLNNDLMSYNKEQAVGRDQYNIITVLTQQDDTMDLEGATTWVSAYHHKLQADFRDGLRRMPSFGAERDAQVQEYLGHLANWPRAQDCWNFESQRYFGSKGSEIQVTRRVPLLAKIEMDAKLTREDVVLPLIELWLV